MLALNLHFSTIGLKDLFCSIGYSDQTASHFTLQNSALVEGRAGGGNLAWRSPFTGNLSVQNTSRLGRSLPSLTLRSSPRSHQYSGGTQMPQAFVPRRSPMSKHPTKKPSTLLLSSGPLPPARLSLATPLWKRQDGHVFKIHLILLSKLTRY